MFPGFVYIYKDSEQFVHLRFFEGISDNNKPIYRELDIKKEKIAFDKQYIDGMVDYKFEDKSIIEITCKLITLLGKKTFKKLILR